MLKQAAEQVDKVPQPAEGNVDVGSPPTAAEGVGMIQEGKTTPAGSEEAATPEEQAEYERAVGALGKVMYEDEESSEAILDQLREEDPIGSITKASVLLVRQLDDRLDLDENVIAQFTLEVVDRMVDLYQEKTGQPLEDADVEKVVASTWEGIMQVYDIDEEDYRQFTDGLSEDEVKSMEQSYKQKLGGEI